MSYNTKAQCQSCVPHCCGHHWVKRSTKNKTCCARGNKKDTIFPPPHSNRLTNQEVTLAQQLLHVLAKHASCNILAGNCLHSPEVSTGDIASEEPTQVCAIFLTLLYIVFMSPLLSQGAVAPSEPKTDWGIKILEASAQVLTPRYDQNPKGLSYPNPFEVKEALKDPQETPLGKHRGGIWDLGPAVETANQANHRRDGFTEAQTPKELGWYSLNIS